MLKRSALAALLALVMTACAPQYSIRESSDPVFGSTSVRLEANRLQGACLGCAAVDLNIFKFTNAAGRVLYSLVINYESSEWLFIERGQSLALRVDGDLIRLSTDEGSSPYRNVRSRGMVTETAYYDVGVDLLRRLAEASEVLVRVDGRAMYVAREFGPENFANFQRFVVEHVN